MMNKLSYFGIFAILILCFTCTDDTSSTLTFSDIEEKYSFAKPLSDKSKENIIMKFGSVNNYDAYLKNLDIFKTEIAQETSILSRMLAVYVVTYNILGDNSSMHTQFDCADDQYILDAAIENSIDLPYSCMAGACSTCVAKLNQGEVDQADQSFLDEDCVERGYVALCAAYPRSNIDITTHYESEMNCAPFIIFKD